MEMFEIQDQPPAVIQNSGRLLHYAVWELIHGEHQQHNATLGKMQLQKAVVTFT